MNSFVHNNETGKLELHCDKAFYAALTDAQKQSIKGAFVWGRRSGCWISRCKEPNLWHAEQVAKALELADAGAIGERLSFAEQQERKAEKAEHRAERFEASADRAAARGEALQKPINDMRGDVAFFTQPNINSSAGRAFTRQRERMFAAYEAGFKAFNKSNYYRERAATARDTSAQKGLQDKGFIGRRIAECESSLRKLKKNVDQYESTRQRIEQGAQLTRYNGEPLTLDAVNEWIETTLDRMEPHPFKVGDTFTCSRWNREKGDVDVLEFRIIRATDKSVTIQTGNEKPFVRKPSQITWDKSGKWRLRITDWNDGIVYKLPSE